MRGRFSLPENLDFCRKPKKPVGGGEKSTEAQKNPRVAKSDQKKGSIVRRGCFLVVRV